MFNGSHLVIFSKKPEADRALIAKLFSGKQVDAGDGWMIHELPPAEIAIHPSGASTHHELHMMCEDIEAARQRLAGLGIESAEPIDQGYGIVSEFTMPGGSVVGFYQPRHASAV
ncbi:MAG: VOC family protein [Boseongicola sp.]